jgi:hypothetical protein
VTRRLVVGCDATWNTASDDTTVRLCTSGWPGPTETFRPGDELVLAVALRVTRVG